MHPCPPHQLLRPVLFLVLEDVPVVVNLLLDVVEGLPGHGLRDEREPEVLSSIKLHEDFHGPEIIRRSRHSAEPS